MIRVSTRDPEFQEAWRKAHLALPVEPLELPRQYGQRWRETYRCRIDPTESKLGETWYIFDDDRDYTWFMLKWS